MARRSERFARYVLMPCFTASLLSMFFLQPLSSVAMQPLSRAAIMRPRAVAGSLMLFTFRLYRGGPSRQGGVCGPGVVDRGTRLCPQYKYLGIFGLAEAA